MKKNRNQHLQNNGEFGKNLMTTNCIKVDKLLFLIDAFGLDTSECEQSYCKNGMQFSKCFIPCPNCSDVMLRDQICMASVARIHNIACDAMYHKIPQVTSIDKSILFAITVSTPPNTNELIEFVVMTETTRNYNLPDCDTVMRYKYKVFLQLYKGNRISCLNSVRSKFIT